MIIDYALQVHIRYIPIGRQVYEENNIIIVNLMFYNS